MKLTVNLGAKQLPDLYKKQHTESGGYLYPRSLSWSQNYDHL